MTDRELSLLQQTGEVRLNPGTSLLDITDGVATLGIDPAQVTLHPWYLSLIVRVKEEGT